MKAAELPPGKPEMSQDTQEFDSEKQPEPQGPVNPLQEELDTLRSEMALLKTEALRERADLENQRKRVARDVEQARKFANEKLLAEMLPVFDSIEAGLASAPADDPLRAGLELTLKQLHDVTGRNGLSEVVAEPGGVFNPEQHNAISQVPEDGIPSGSIVQVFQKGYTLNDRLLRPAMVVVAP